MKTNYVRVEEARNLRPFTKHLLQMDSRIRLHELVDDLDDEKFLFVTKQFLHTPYVFPPVEHEIAHIVELKNKARLTLPNLGMETYTDMDKVKPAGFFAALAREVRTRAIQLHMMPDELKNKNGTIYNILNNQLTWGDYATTHSPYGRFRNYNDVFAWVSDMREKTFRAWSPERIEDEWKTRLHHIQNWMETT